jgi:hypothetical protein
MRVARNRTPPLALVIVIFLVIPSAVVIVVAFIVPVIAMVVVCVVVTVSSVVVVEVVERSVFVATAPTGSRRGDGLGDLWTGCRRDGRR